jgi:transposase
MTKKYIVRLSDEEREQLLGIVRLGKTEAYRIRHANILLKSDAEQENWSDARIAKAFSCHERTVAGIRKRFVLEGFEPALGRKPQQHPSRSRSLDGESEARLLALSLSQPPQGRTSWTLRLLSEKLVELEIVDSISHETIRTTLKKMKSNPT